MSKTSKKSHRGTLLPAEAADVFVCVRNRHGKGVSCGASGSLKLVREMRAMLAAEHIGAEELNIRPVGCLGLCKLGPVCAAAPAQGDGAKRAPKLKKRKSETGLFTRVGEEDLRPMLRQVLVQLTGSGGASRQRGKQERARA